MVAACDGGVGDAKGVVNVRAEGLARGDREAA